MKQPKHGAPPHKRGKLTPKRNEGSLSPTAHALLRAAAPDLQPSTIAGSPGQQLQALRQLAVTPERIAALESTLLGLSEHALTHVGYHLLQIRPGDDVPKGLKELTTVAAIMVDKLLILQQNRSSLAGGSSQATMEQLGKKAADILAVVQEVERRQNQTVDITPKPAS